MKKEHLDLISQYLLTNPQAKPGDLFKQFPVLKGSTKLLDEALAYHGTKTAPAAPVAPTPEPPAENPIDLAFKARDLSTRKKVQAVETVNGLEQSEVDDEAAQAEAKALKEKLKAGGLDADEIYNELSDYPQKAYAMPTGGKDALLQLRKTNPVEYKARINNTKNQFSILEGAAKNAKQNLPPEAAGTARSIAVQTANEYNRLNEVRSLPELFRNVKRQQQIIGETLTGDDRDKALERLQGSTAHLINATDPDFVKEYEASDLKGIVDPNQYAGLKTLQLYHPERYEQAVKLLRYKPVSKYHTEGGFDPFTGKFDTEMVEEEAPVNEKKGAEALRKQLADTGRTNMATWAQRQLFNLNNQYASAPPEAQAAVAKKITGYQALLDGIALDEKKDDERYPLLAAMKFNDQVKELTQNAGMNPLEYSLYHFGKTLDKTMNSVENIGTNVFGSEEDKAGLQVKRLGELKTDESVGYLPERLKFDNSPVIPVFSKELQQQRDAIMNDAGLNDDEKKVKLAALVRQKQDAIDFITNPEAGGHKNFLSAATLYGNAGMLGDIAGIAVQSYALGLGGAGSMVSAAVPMFTMAQDDAYKQAIADGRPNAMEYSTTHALIMAAAGLINPDLAIVRRSLGLKSAAGKAIAGIDEATWNSVVSKSAPMIERFQNSALSVSKEAAKMGAVYGAGTAVATDLTDKYLYGKNVSGSEMVDHAVKGMRDITLNSLVLFGVNAVSNFKATTPQQKAAVWQLGENRDLSLAHIEDAKRAGEITPQEAEKRVAVVKQVASLVEKLPAQTLDGKPLTDGARMDYLYNLYVKGKAKELKAVLPESEAAKLESAVVDADAANSRLLNGKKPIAPQETKIYTQKNIAEAEKDAEGHSGVQGKVLKDATGVMRAWSKLLPDMQVLVHHSPEAYKEEVLKAGGEEGDADTSGFWMSPEGSIHLNMAEVQRNTALHEGAHPLLDMISRKAPEVIDTMHNELASLKEGEPYIKFGKEYEGDHTQKVEALTEFLADVADGKVVINAGNFERVKQFLVKLLNGMGLKIDPKALVNLADGSDLRRIAEGFKSSVKEGKAIEGEMLAGEGDPQFQKKDGDLEGMPLSEKEFYKTYKAQHKDLRSKTPEEQDAVKESIAANGFNRGLNANALPVFKGGETDIISQRYGNKKGDVVYLLSKDGVKDTPNGYQAKEGYKPSAVVRIEYDGQPTYEAYLKQHGDNPKFQKPKPEDEIHIVKASEGFKNFAEAESYAREHFIGKSFKNAHTGEEILVGVNGIKKSLQPSATNKSVSIETHLKALRQLPDILKESVQMEIEKGKADERNDVKRLYGAITINGELYRVKTTVKKSLNKDNRFYTHEVQEIELLDERPAFKGEVFDGNQSKAPSTSANSILLSKLLKNVTDSNGKPFFDAPQFQRTARDIMAEHIEFDPKDDGLLKKLFGTKGEGGFNITWLTRLNANLANPMRVFDKAFEYAKGVKGIDEVLPANDPTVLSRIFLGSEGKFGEILKTGMVDAKNNVLKDANGEAKNLDWLLKPFDIASEKTIEKDMQDTVIYMVAERTLELEKKLGRDNALTGITDGTMKDVEVARKTMEEFTTGDPDKLSRIQEAASRYREFADDMLQYMVDKGRMSEEQYNLIKKENLQYVALQRVLETDGGQEIVVAHGGGGKSIGSKTEVVKTIKGSERKIANPYSSLLDTLYKSVKEADRNEIMQAFRNMVVDDRPAAQAGVIDAGLGYIARKVKAGDKNAVTIFVKGKPEHWELAPDIFKAVKGLDGDHGNIPLPLRIPGMALRWTVTHSPIFAVKNTVRDTQDRLIKSTSNRGLNGITNMAGAKEDWHAIARNGGLNAGYYVKSKQYYHGLLKVRMEEMATDKRFILVDPIRLKEVWHKYENFLYKSETVNRVAEYRSAREQAKRKGMDDYNASLYAADKARGLLDFAVMGHYMRIINQLVPFSNAMVQGLRTTALSYKKNPAAFAARVALYSIAPSVAFWLMNHRNDEDSEQYENLPVYQRDLFYNVKIGDNKWLSIAKPYELSLPAAGVDRLLSYHHGNKEAFAGYAGSVVKSLTFFDEGTLAGPYAAGVEVLANHDFFRDKYIIPPDQDVLALALRNTENASRFGQMIQKAAGTDARKADYFMRRQFSYFGNAAVKASNLGREDGNDHFNLTDLGFFKESPAYNAPAVQDMVKFAQEYRLTRSDEYMTFSMAAQDYWAAQTDAEKEQLGKDLIVQAKELLQMWKDIGMDEIQVEKSDAKKEAKASQAGEAAAAPAKAKPKSWLD